MLYKTPPLLCLTCILCKLYYAVSLPLPEGDNLVPRVLRLFGQQLVVRRDSGELDFLLPQDFSGKTMQAVTEQPIKKFNFFRVT